MAMLIFLPLILLCLGAFLPVHGRRDQLSEDALALRKIDANTDVAIKFYAASRETSSIKCPAQVIHHTKLIPHPKAKNTFLIPHSDIYMNGVQCAPKNESQKSPEDNPYLWVIPAKYLTDRERAVATGVGDAYAAMISNGRGYRAFISISAIDGTYVGIEHKTDRDCGGKGTLLYARTTVFVMIKPTVNDLDFTSNLGYIFKDEVGMLSFSPDGKACALKNSRRASPTETPYPALKPFQTETATPRPESPSPSVSASPAQPSPSPAQPSPSPAQASPGPVSISPDASSSESLPPTNTPTSGGGDTPKPSETSIVQGPVPTSNGDDEPACFPADATVQLKKGKTIKISELKVGDEVLSGPGIYSKVFMFTHKDESKDSEFVQVTTENGSTLSLSRGHYLYVSGSLSAAEFIEAGHMVQTDNGQWDKVVYKDVVEGKGLYNPQTLSGYIVVNGITASTYTTAVNPCVAHALLTPMRWLFRAGILPRQIGDLFNVANHGLSTLLPRGHQNLAQRNLQMLSIW